MFQNDNPIVIHSSDKIDLLYKANNFNIKEKSQMMQFSIDYEFVKTKKVNCEKRFFNSSKGL